MALRVEKTVIILWVEARDTAKHPTTQNTDPQTDYMAQNISSVKFEKFSIKLMLKLFNLSSMHIYGIEFKLPLYLTYSIFIAETRIIKR